MIFKPGDKVIITFVPERAARWVKIGMHGVIEPAPENIHHVEDQRLYVVKIGNFCFWWDVKDFMLAPHVLH